MKMSSSKPLQKENENISGILSHYISNKIKYIQETSFCDDNVVSSKLI